MGRAQFSGPVPVRVSLDSVPDGRSPVPLLWWVPVVAAVMLGVTTAAILPASGSFGLTIGALGVNLVGYGAVWSRIRPAPLRLSPRFYWPTVVAGQMMSDAVTAPIEMARTAPPSGGLLRTAEVKGFCALIILGWAVTGFSVGCIALRHSRHSAQRSR